MIAVDLHVHTEFSSDGLMSLRRLIQICHKRGLGCIAVTDHNVIEGALRLCAMTEELGDLKIIVGEEIRSSDGEVTGLFLKREIPRDLPIERTIELIREQGGLVYLPHPCDRLRRSRIRPEKLESVLPLCDIVEVFNARNVFDKDNAESQRLAEALGLVQAVGSDAHTPMEMGHCYQNMEAFGGPGVDERLDFLEKLRAAEPVTRKSPLVVHGITKTMKALNRLSGGGNPGGTASKTKEG